MRVSVTVRVCMCVKERDRGGGRDTDRQTDRQTDTVKETERPRDRERRTHSTERHRVGGGGVMREGEEEED